MLGNTISSLATTTDGFIRTNLLPAGMYLVPWKKTDIGNRTENRFVRMK